MDRAMTIIYVEAFRTMLRKWRAERAQGAVEADLDETQTTDAQQSPAGNDAMDAAS